MANELDRAEQKVEDRSAPLKKELGLRDLVLTQILFIVGSSWVGTAAKLGQSHLFFWLLAILLFYIPQAAVVIYLNRLMPLEGGIYQWAKIGFNEFAGLHRGVECVATLHHGHRAWGNVCHDQHLLRDRRKRRLDAEQQMVRVIDQLRPRDRPWLDGRTRSGVGQVGS